MKDASRSKTKGGAAGILEAEEESVGAALAERVGAGVGAFTKKSPVLPLPAAAAAVLGRCILRTAAAGFAAAPLPTLV